jgi:hypothetical protein
VVIGRAGAARGGQRAWSTSRLRAAQRRHRARPAEDGRAVGARQGVRHLLPGGSMVPAEGIDPAALEVICRVNGEVRQHGRAAQMAFSIPVLIEYISGIMTLEPGDVIATGTPAGVGPLRPGDVVEVEIPGVGIHPQPRGVRAMKTQLTRRWIGPGIVGLVAGGLGLTKFWMHNRIRWASRTPWWTAGSTSRTGKNPGSPSACSRTARFAVADPLLARWRWSGSVLFGRILRPPRTVRRGSPRRW